MGETRHADKSPDAFRTISEVADELELPQHVLRFWETRFTQIKPVKRAGGRRFYRPDDVDLLRGIRHLLYSEGYTIKGVQKILKDNGIRHVQGIGTDTDGAPYNVEPEPAPEPRGGRGEGLTGLLGLLPRRRGRPEEPVEEFHQEPSFGSPSLGSPALGREPAARRAPSIDDAPLYEPPAPVPPEPEPPVADSPYWRDEPALTRDGPRAARPQPAALQPARPVRPAPEPAPSQRSKAVPVQRPLFDEYPIVPPPEMEPEALDNGAYDDYGDDFGEPDMFDPEPPPRARRQDAGPPDLPYRAEMHFPPEPEPEPPAPVPPPTSAAAARPAPVPPRPRPTRGPASRIPLAPPVPELEDPLLPFFDDEPVEPPTEQISESLEARIRRLKEQAPHMPVPDPEMPPFGAPGYVPHAAMAAPPPYPQGGHPGYPPAGPHFPGEPAAYAGAHGAPAQPPAYGMPAYGAYPPPPYAAPAPAPHGAAPHSAYAPAAHAPAGAPYPAAPYSPVPQHSGYEPAPQSAPPQAMQPGPPVAAGGAPSAGQLAPSPAPFGHPYGTVPPMTYGQPGAARQPGPPEDYIPARARQRAPGEAAAMAGPEERVGPLTGPLVEYEPDLDPPPAILRRTPEASSPSAEREHQDVPPNAWLDVEMRAAEVAGAGPSDPYLPPRLRAEPRAPAGGQPVPVLSRDDIHRLQAALYELGECRRVLGGALSRAGLDPDEA